MASRRAACHPDPDRTAVRAPGGRRQPAGAPGTIVTACRPGGDSARMQRLGTLYRGREGMWTWVLHRISGVALLFDFWSKGIARQRQMLWLQTVLFVLLATPAAVAIGGKIIEELRA